ncbi:MAG: hypothetical protein LAO05_09210 [Acidobacteriia bacterium]|nr:hypothetical protein [Terriglobia bacterium]
MRSWPGDGRGEIIMVRTAGAVLGAVVLAQAAGAQFAQQGSKLVGSGAVGAAEQGKSVAISADGNTAAVGGWFDDSLIGAVWLFARSFGAWTQQGGKLVGSGAVGGASQGSAVALSADGNTLIVGGFSDDGNLGAAWVFTRSGGVWSQQGSKLVGEDAVGLAYQGASVALSADGNTAIVGGWGDSSSIGAAWVFTRTGGVWSQQGGKLVATDSVGPAQQGYSVAISADGDTAVAGGWGDSSGLGATWVYTRSEGVWLQQGRKLVGNSAIGRSAQGTSVAVSADGNTVLVGGWGDSSSIGAAWVFTRSDGVWSQRGAKLVGAGATDPDNHIQFGSAAALSADGKTGMVGGAHDSGYLGAVWVFAPGALTWVQQGSKLVGTGNVGMAHQGISAALSANGSAAIVGGSNDNSLAGAAWVFVATGCARPWVTGQPQDRSVPSGQEAVLSVTAIGTAPLSYQWYQGEAGDTSTPVGSDASTLTTTPLTPSASFWVRVTNACGTADSAAATISIGRPVRRHVRRSG